MTTTLELPEEQFLDLQKEIASLPCSKTERLAERLAEAEGGCTSGCQDCQDIADIGKLATPAVTQIRFVELASKNKVLDEAEAQEAYKLYRIAVRRAVTTPEHLELHRRAKEIRSKLRPSASPSDSEAEELYRQLGKIAERRNELRQSVMAESRGV